MKRTNFFKSSFLLLTQSSRIVKIKHFPSELFRSELREHFSEWKILKVDNRVSHFASQVVVGKSKEKDENLKMSELRPFFVR